jgi:hypothetical protein
MNHRYRLSISELPVVAPVSLWRGFFHAMASSKPTQASDFGAGCVESAAILHLSWRAGITVAARSIDPVILNQPPAVRSQFKIINWFLIENDAFDRHCFDGFRTLAALPETESGALPKKIPGKLQGPGSGKVHALKV